ncbi:flagellar basal body-associated FliL family protein [Candidatus Desantisbacteria bacterium]|nr:flagellar basal body-associated FliL family protein [Candidatus Desantisbacteria bacterium]
MGSEGNSTAKENVVDLKTLDDKKKGMDKKTETGKKAGMKTGLLNIILKYKLIIIIFLVSVLLLFGGFIVWKKVFSSGHKSKENLKSEIKEEEVFIPGINEMPIAIAPLGDFIVSLNDSSNEKHYLKTSLSVELDKQEAVNEIKLREVQIKDIVIGVISSRDSVIILNPQEKDNIKKELQKAINLLLVKGKITNVYFTEFVAQ